MNSLKRTSESPAPIALFTYARPLHTQRTIDALLANTYASKSDLFIFCDAPRDDAATDAVGEVRRYVRTVSGFRRVEIIERTSNLGLAKSIISGVTEVVSRSGRIIVLEDDLVTAPHFLSFMNRALWRYQNEEQVISITGYFYPTNIPLPECFFLRGADCWGWATWERGWSLFNPDGKALLDQLQQQDLRNDFDFGGAASYTKMLEEQVAGKNDSWAVRWYASAFLGRKLTLYPHKSLVQNIGLDGSGTHCGSSSLFDVPVVRNDIALLPDAIEESQAARRAAATFFSSVNRRPSTFRSIKAKLASIFR